MGSGNKSVVAKSHDQDGHHAHIKTTQKSSSPEPASRFIRNLVCSIKDFSTL